MRIKQAQGRVGFEQDNSGRISSQNKRSEVPGLDLEKHPSD
jgi:hypothetical protein